MIGILKWATCGTCGPACRCVNVASRWACQCEQWRDGRPSRGDERGESRDSKKGAQTRRVQEFSARVRIASHTPWNASIVAKSSQSAKEESRRRLSRAHDRLRWRQVHCRICSTLRQIELVTRALLSFHRLAHRRSSPIPAVRQACSFWPSFSRQRYRRRLRRRMLCTSKGRDRWSGSPVMGQASTTSRV